MLKHKVTHQLEKDEKPEEYIKNRIADINKKKAFLCAQLYPEVPLIEKEKDILALNELCDKVEAILPDVEKLIKRIFPYIKSITEETKVVAAYLLIGRAYSNLETALLVCRNGKNLEAMELSRSGKEALDLSILFWDDKNQLLLEKWFKGVLISNSEAREFQHEHLNEGLADIFEDEEQPIKEMLGKGYKIMSTYTHSGYAGLLDCIDVFRLDFDFEAQAGYHYCIENFHIVNDLLIKILLNLKNSFLHLQDHEAFAEANRLFKPFDKKLTTEQMKAIVSRHKKVSEEKLI